MIFLHFVPLGCSESTKRNQDDADVATDTDIAQDGSDENVEGGPCPTGFTECEERCMDTMGDFNHCGACDSPCTAANSACIDGTCTAYCGEAEAASAEQLAALLGGEGWEGVVGTVKYISVTGSVELDASLVAEGGMFRLDGDPLPGITLEDPVQFGFDESLSDNCCGSIDDMIYPQTGHTRAVFEDVSFIAEMKTYRGGSGSGTCSEDTCVTWWFSSSMECIYPIACCCAADPVQWAIVTLSPLPEACTDQPPCASGYTGMNPSICYEDYASYMAGQAGIHIDCIDPTGHITSGEPCTCTVGWDHQRDVDGTCTDRGICDIVMPSDSPPVPGCG